MREHRAELASLRWRKSSYSNQEGGDCVEVADGHPTAVPVRDSKAPAVGTLLIPADSWQAFVTVLRDA